MKFANEDTAERQIVGMVEVEICGRKGWFEAVVEPNKKYPLIGAVVMESLDLIVEPRSMGISADFKEGLTRTIEWYKRE